MKNNCLSKMHEYTDQTVAKYFIIHLSLSFFEY